MISICNRIFSAQVFWIITFWVILADSFMSAIPDSQGGLFHDAMGTDANMDQPDQIDAAFLIRTLNKDPVSAFHSEHQTEDWLNYIGSNPDVSFVQWLRNNVIGAFESVVVYTNSIALTGGWDFDPTPVESKKGTWDMKVNDCYLEMMKPESKACDFSRKQLFDVLKSALTASECTKEEIDGVISGAVTAPNEGVLKLIRDLTK